MAAINYNTADFVRLVQQMRSAQQAYFGARMGSSKSDARFHLQHAKELEQQVDHYAAKMEAKLKERSKW